MTNVLDLIMGIEEASEKWGLDCTTIRKLCQKGQIKARKIGDTWLMAVDTERPGVQRNLFVWKDYILPREDYDQRDINQFAQFNFYREIESMVHKLKRLKDNRISGDNRRSIKGNVIDQFQRLNVLLFVQMGGSAAERKEKLVRIIKEKLSS